MSKYIINAVRSFELEPIDNRKSFYGKCKVFEMEDGSKVLRSYNTYVCKIDPDKTFHKTWSEYSPTTMRHINAFLDYYGIEGGGKKWWESLPCEDY